MTVERASAAAAARPVVDVHVDYDDPGFAARIYSELVSSESALVILGIDDQRRLLAMLAPFARRAGQSMYAFTDEVGLVSLRDEGIAVPQTKRTAEALRHILQSSHFGVYLFPDGASHATGQCLATLKQLARRRPAGDKRVVLLTPSVTAIPALMDFASLVAQRARAAGKLKLRDGKWVRG